MEKVCVQESEFGRGGQRESKRVRKRGCQREKEREQKGGSER